MPNRFIRECCRTSPTLQKLTNFQERLFWRILTLTDDFGRFEADPMAIKNTCFPLGCKETVEDVCKCLQLLANVNTLILYENSGRRYGEFVNFARYQGEPRAKKSKHPDPHMQTSANICSQMHENAPSYVSDSVSESDNNLKKDYMSGKPDHVQLLEYLNKKAGRKYSTNGASGELAKARLKQFSLDQLKSVVDEKVKEWATDEKMMAFLRPETLFGKTKCEGYVGQLGMVKPGAVVRPGQKDPKTGKIRVAF